MSDPPIKRYRRDPSPKSEDSEEDGGYVPHVSVADHRRQQLVKLGRAEAGGSRLEALRQDPASNPSSGHTSEAEGGPGIPELARREEMEKNESVSMLEQHKELQEIAEEKNESLKKYCKENNLRPKYQHSFVGNRARLILTVGRESVIVMDRPGPETIPQIRMRASQKWMETHAKSQAGPSKVTSVMSSSTSKPQKTNSFKYSSVFDDVEDDPFIVQIQERQRKKEEKNKRERQRRRDRKSLASIAKMIQSSQPVSLKKEGEEVFKTFSVTSQGDEEEDFKEAKKSSQRDRKGGQRKGNQGVQKIDKFMKKEGKRKGREEEDCLPSIDELLAMPERNEDGKTIDNILDEEDKEIAKRQERHKKEMEKVEHEMELEEQKRRDREARYVVNAGHRDRLAAEITQPVLRRMFDDNLEFLKSIRDGRTESSRHTAFHKNPMTRQALLYTMITHPFTDAQVDWTLECMTEVWMKTRKEQADNNEYIWKVLMSECLTKFYGDYFKISKIEALRRIKETPFEDEDD